ncbi:hypothetical protein AXF42_Ash019986 [Apostasia shenzhenica]|uniref:Uncharacterized protein n=1 Tax=Apostasia shenzhenica TaxID=1088818 RepID=A0A2H9ZSH1_9ASPA|nr:hypothetical protein AXF42_Ash019986 [Apostasia shenzhenica]
MEYRRNATASQRRPSLRCSCPSTLNSRDFFQKKRIQYEDLTRGHSSQYYSRPSTLNCGVLMGFGASVLVWSHLYC